MSTCNLSTQEAKAGRQTASPTPVWTTKWDHHTAKVCGHSDEFNSQHCKGHKPTSSFYSYQPSFKILLDSRWSLLSEPTDIYNSFRSLDASKSWRKQFWIISSNSSRKTDEKPRWKKTSISDRNAIHGRTAIRGYFLCNRWYWTTLSNINKPQFRRVRPNTRWLNSIFVD